MSIIQTGLKKKIRINGIKLSTRLVQINLLSGSLPEKARPLFFRLLSQHQINIPSILISNLGEKVVASCCVDAEDINRVKNVMDKEPTLKENIALISSVGALSIFPHYSNLKLLGLSFYLFGKQNFPLYGMASSISSLTFITNYSQLDEAVSILLEYMELPPNHSPFRPEIHVIQKKR
ncbi:MAG: hypothetical protein LJE66_08760 [Desulfobacterales bacterium]|jgi:aspartokinase|nr:hypothetical protein [Desulfobacterales bacterium]